MKKFFIKLRRPFSSYICKCRQGNRFRSKVVEAFSTWCNRLYAISKAWSGCQLHKHKIIKLVPATKRPCLSASSMPFFKGLKFMSRNNFKHVVKKCVIMCHGSKLPFFSMPYGQTHNNRFLEISDLLNSLTEQKL